ncbi:ATP-dependent endonuclease, partial [Methylococcaceae bacterium CS5]
EVPDLVPDWDSLDDPNLFNLSYGGELKNIVNELETCDVYFSSPLDIDYSMICAFPEVFCLKDETYGERGPTEGKADEEYDDREKRVEALIKAVLKKGNAGKRFAFGDGWERNFRWYRYRFLSNKSKPASHVRMFMKIESEYNSEEIKAKLPLELNRLAVRVIELAQQVVE